MGSVGSELQVMNMCWCSINFSLVQGVGHGRRRGQCGASGQSSGLKMESAKESVADGESEWVQ